MKKLLLIFSIVLLLTSCGNDKLSKEELEKQLQEYNTEELYKASLPYKEVSFIAPEYWNGHEKKIAYIIEIDSCEYISYSFSGGYQAEGYLAHKGNCKYCKARQEKLIFKK